MESKLISSLVFVLMLAFAIEAKKRKGYTGGEVKPGHYSIKEFHFHIYFRRNFEAEVQAAYALKEKIVAEVIAGNMTVVCDGITSNIIPGLDDSKVPGFYIDPYGPHPVGNFKVWTPREHLADMMSFMMLHRGDLSVLLHPLGHDEMEDHTADAMWLGPSTRIDIHHLSDAGGDDPEFPELGLGYSKISDL